MKDSTKKKGEKNKWMLEISQSNQKKNETSFNFSSQSWQPHIPHLQKINLYQAQESKTFNAQGNKKKPEGKPSRIARSVK